MERVLSHPQIDERRSLVCAQCSRGVETTYSAVTAEQITDEVAARRKALFDKYVTPYTRMIYKLCIRYTFDSSNIEDNYVEVLTNMYKYIETYDSERSIHTWLHIVTKRCVYDLDQRRKKQQDMRNCDNDIETYASEDMLTDLEEVSSNVMGISNYRELYNDDILNALDQLKPQYKRALLYQQAGYKLKEIAEIEYRNGALESRNIETIKSRLFLARQTLQQLLTRDGKRRPTGEAD